MTMERLEENSEVLNDRRKRSTGHGVIYLSESIGIVEIETETFIQSYWNIHFLVVVESIKHNFFYF